MNPVLFLLSSVEGWLICFDLIDLISNLWVSEGEWVVSQNNESRTMLAVLVHPSASVIITSSVPIEIQFYQQVILLLREILSQNDLL